MTLLMFTWEGIIAIPLRVSLVKAFTTFIAPANPLTGVEEISSTASIGAPTTLIDTIASLQLIGFILSQM
ncbi:hypothetical protein D3C87_1565890 [compost metagenome]